MKWLGRFWRQPSRSYRNFQIVYAILTLNFIVPAISYYVDRHAAVDSAYRIGELFGAHAHPATEDSYLWWILGAGNVATLGIMCLMLQVNLRYFFPILWALVTLKGLSSIGYLGVFTLGPDNATFLAAFLLDGFTVFLMLWFAIRARRSLDRDSDDLLPKPWSTQRFGRLSAADRRHADVLAATLVPAGLDRKLPSGAGSAAVVDAVQGQLTAAPLGAKLGIRLAVKAVNWAPPLVMGKPHLLAGLSESERVRYLESLENHRVYAVRQVFAALKASILLAYCGDSEVREGLAAYRSN